MKILNFFFALFLCQVGTAFCVENIIFELDEIVFNLNPAPALKALGLSFLGETLTETYQKRLIELIESEEKNSKHPEGAEKAIYRHCRLPFIWCAYLMNKIHGKDALKAIKKIIEKKAWFHEKAILNHAADLSFNPEKEVGLLNPNQELIKLLQHLKTNGINLYILTNKNKSTIEELIKKYPEVMKCFDQIICSGQSGHIKPHADAFNFLINSHQLDPKKTLIIEKEIECYKKAQTLGFQALLFNNYDDLLKKLYKENVITAPL